MTAPDIPLGSREPTTALAVDRTCQTVICGRRAARVLSDWTRRYALSEPEFQVLWCLRSVSNEGVDQTTLAQRLSFSAAQVSATVERLRAQNWIEQHALVGDRRRHLWRLSAVGLELLSAMLGDQRVLVDIAQQGESAAANRAIGREEAA